MRSAFKRFPKRSVMTSVLLVVAPMGAAFWLILGEDLPREERVPHRPASGRVDVIEGFPLPPSPLEPETPPLPEELAAARILSEEVSNEEAAAISRHPDRPPSERYLALRQLEKRNPGVAVAQAEALVREAGRSREDRFLAVNALGVLARSPGGRPALERCTSSAPTEELRKAARLLLRR